MFSSSSLSIWKNADLIASAPTMDALLISTGIVALAEIGDKTQLLTLVLAARYRKPWPIVSGIFVATLINHGIAGAVGAWLTSAIGPSAMRWVLGLSFLAMAVWMLIPDKLDDDTGESKRIGGVFLSTAVLFFFVEMGDKTQIATVALAARFDSLAAVVLGTTLGMMLANAPVAFFGDAIAKRLPVSIVHRVAAAVFALLGIGVLVTG
jgi:putative Ca2+/H+ antiporter (TMEM165/GDT1 family)